MVDRTVNVCLTTIYDIQINNKILLYEILEINITTNKQSSRKTFEQHFIKAKFNQKNIE